MLVKELQAKSREELLKLIDDLKAELFMLRFKNSTGQLKEVHKIELAKKDIARIFTVLSQKAKEAKNPSPNQTAPKAKSTKAVKTSLKSKVKLKPKSKDSKPAKAEKPIKEGA